MAISNNQRRITVAEMAPHVHSFRAGENKTSKIYDWLSKWIKQALKDGRIKPDDYLPQKGDLAFHIGVSAGTIQNVYRMIEDAGLVESKQKVGTVIKNQEAESSEKLTSKRDAATEMIKAYVIQNDYKIGESLVSTRNMAKILGISATTVRIALNKLIAEGIITVDNKQYTVKNLNFKINKQNEVKTLVDKIAERINKYIKQNLKKGDKLPSSTTFADMYNVSIKTIHDAIYVLSVAGLVKTKRGYYGTIVADTDDETLYFYEQVELKIKKYIAENCKPNDKLPTIKEFAEVFNVSTKTIKNALDNLAEDGYITFIRGRNGGTFVLELPIITEQGYTWLALSSEFEPKLN